MNAIPLARSGAILPFVGFLDDIGAPGERLLENVGLSPVILARQDALFPLNQGLRFLDAAVRSEGIKDLGLIVGRRTRITDLADLGQLLSPSKTLGEAIALLVEAIRFFSSWQRLSLRWRGEKACFSHCLAHSPHRHSDVFTLMLMIDVVRLAAGPRWRPNAIHVPAHEAHNRKAHEAAMEIPCQSGTDRWTVVFDGSLLNERLRYCAPNAHAADAMGELRRAAPADDFAGSLRQVIGSLLPAGSSGLAAAAEAAGLSARTLQRRLNASGCTYSELLEDARRQAALRLLRDKKIKILDIALELGYSDPANFTRAFRKWTGASPRTARRGGSAG